MGRQRLSSSHSLEFLNIEEPAKEKGGSAKPVKSSLKNTFMSLPRPGRSRRSPDTAEPRLPVAVTSQPDVEMVAMAAPPRPPHQSAEEIVNNFCAMKRNSLIRRERPVSPGMRRRSVTSRRSNDVESTSGIAQPTEVGFIVLSSSILFVLLPFSLLATVAE